MKSKFILSIMTALAVTLTPATASTQTIASAQASAISLNTTDAALYPSESFQLSIQGTSKKAKWNSSKPSIATVNQNGTVTAKAVGTSTITAKIGSKTYQCKITVKSPELSRSELLMNTGNSREIKLNGTKKPITWTSSDPKVATIQKGVIKAVGDGACIITATVNGTSNKYECLVMVKNWLSSDTPSINLKVGESQRIMITYAMTWMDIPYSFYANSNNQNTDGGLEVIWDEKATSERTDETPDAFCEYGMTVKGLTPGKSQLIIGVDTGEPFNGECEYIVIPVVITK